MHGKPFSNLQQFSFDKPMPILLLQPTVYTLKVLNAEWSEMFLVVERKLVSSVT